MMKTPQNATYFCTYLALFTAIGIMSGMKITLKRMAGA
jgi:hypothetical protein